ncbi:MAG: hypothetical protein Q9216_000704 [Gyalolechia sp. 2 TL-2023]
MSSETSNLLALPSEILVLIRNDLANIEDFKELSSTCRALRALCGCAPPNLVLRLAAASSAVFFRPDPYFLVAATADQIGRWALRSESNTAQFRKALKGGIEGLFDLLHASRFTTFNPVTDLIDRCAGRQWYDIEDFWGGARSDAETISCEPERALFEIAIYGALFQPTLEANLDGRKGLDLDTRLDFIKYCIPDWYCQSYKAFTVEATGPYRNGWDNVNPRMDQYSIRHILKSSKWRKAWDEMREEIGPDFVDERRQRIWACAVQMHGLEGLEILRPGGTDKWRGKLLELREKLEKMDATNMKSLIQRIDVHHEIDWLECPILEDEIYCCVRGMWPGHG